jgi:amidase
MTTDRMANDQTSIGTSPPDDPFGALCRDNHVALRGVDAGPLARRRFVAKDVFDIAGYRTGFGNPVWLATHQPALTTALAVLRILEVGADMIGRAVTDELTYSLTGDNIHYGTPVNVRCPDRVPGGSSSGSAAAVAGGLVDFSLGTDCGGSVRVPASYCGVFGMRPTHGRIPLAGVVPFAPSFDTIGWFASDALLLREVGRVLLQDGQSAGRPRRLLIAADCFAMVDRRITDALRSPLDSVANAVGGAEEVTVSEDGLVKWMEVFRTIQAAEIWANHGAWVRTAKPSFGPGIRDRFEWASGVTAEAVEKARKTREMIVARLGTVLGDGDLLCLPTTPSIAPLKESNLTELEIGYRYQAMCLLCIAGLGRLPQISLPLGELDRCPIGLSLIGPCGSDMQLLDMAVSLTQPTGRSKSSED